MNSHPYGVVSWYATISMATIAVGGLGAAVRAPRGCQSAREMHIPMLKGKNNYRRAHMSQTKCACTRAVPLVNFPDTIVLNYHKGILLRNW